MTAAMECPSELNAPTTAKGPSQIAPRSMRRRGQSAVEFALVAPLLFLLMFGIVDFGRAMYYQNEITNAAREGARIAILASNPCNSIYGDPSGDCALPSATPAGPTVCSAAEASGSLIANWTCGDNTSTATPNTMPTSGSPGHAYVDVAQGSTSTCPAPSSSASGVNTTPRSSGNLLISVTIHYYFQPITPIISSFFPSSFYLSSTVCARDEY